MFRSGLEQEGSVVAPLDDSTLAQAMRAPNFSACACIFIISSGPMMPSGKPGKFSTSVVVVSCPPGCVPESISGLRLARAV
jgi:hypothetical protein